MDIAYLASHNCKNYNNGYNCVTLRKQKTHYYHSDYKIKIEK